jgi:hypothetical protein
MVAVHLLEIALESAAYTLPQRFVLLFPRYGKSVP